MTTLVLRRQTDLKIHFNIKMKADPSNILIWASSRFLTEKNMLEVRKTQVQKRTRSISILIFLDAGAAVEQYVVPDFLRQARNLPDYPNSLLRDRPAESEVLRGIRDTHNWAERSSQVCDPEHAEMNIEEHFRYDR